MWRRFYMFRGPAAITAATTGSGYTTVRRFPRPIVIPSVAAPVTGFYITAVIVAPSQTQGQIVGLEYLLGTINIGTGAFTDGVAMPSKTIRGTSVQTAASLAFCAVTSAVSGTSTITITYTNQSGTTGRTASLTLPSSPALGSAFYIHPHLQAGDTGIRDVTNITQSGGTGGVVEVYGLLPIRSVASASMAGQDTSPLAVPELDVLCEPGEAINVYGVGPTGIGDIAVMLAGVPAT